MAYEVGFRAAQRVFRFETAAVHYGYRDRQVGRILPNPICAGQIALQFNRPRQHHRSATARHDAAGFDL